MLRKAFSFLWRTPLSPLICLGLAWLLSHTRIMRAFEWHTLDWRTQLRTYFQPPPDPRVSIVLFEDNTEASITWPPDRSVHGDLVELMTFVHPAVVSFDIILDATREGDGDEKMGHAVAVAARAGVKVVTAGVTSSEPSAPAAEGHEGPTRPLTHVEGDISRLLGDETALLPFPALRAVSLYGFADTPPGDDGIRREIPLAVRVGKEVYPSLGLQTLMAYFDVPADRVRVRLGDAVYLPTKSHGELRLPVSKEGRFLLNYRYDEDKDSGPDFKTYSYIGALVQLNDRFIDKKSPSAEPPEIEGGIVFVGQTVTGKADAGPTPLRAYSPLVLVHANLINNVLRGDYARQAPGWAMLLVTIGLGYLGALLGMRRTVPVMATFGVLGLVVYVVAAFGSWIMYSYWLPLTWPILGGTVLQFVVIGRRILREQRARAQVKQMFGSYLSPELVHRMVQTGEIPQLGGHLEEITSYFSDIQGFSLISERLPPDRLVEWMNEYLSACTDILQGEGGSLDKYIGDAIVMMFGAPMALPDHAYRACVAAVRVQARGAELRAKWRSEGDKWPQLVWHTRTRIGLNTGPCVVGNMGSRVRFNYTMMGDSVNLAARMESGAKKWGVYVMATEATKLMCEQHGGDRVVFRALGRIVVVGRSQPVPIFEVVGLRETIPGAALECVRRFEAGLKCYYRRDWTAAHSLFTQSAELELYQPDYAAGVSTNPSLVYLAIVARCQAMPPPEDWGGVYIMDEK